MSLADRASERPQWPRLSARDATPLGAIFAALGLSAAGVAVLLRLDRLARARWHASRISISRGRSR
jgi:hypothetical protein